MIFQISSNLSDIPTELTDRQIVAKVEEEKVKEKEFGPGGPSKRTHRGQYYTSGFS